MRQVKRTALRNDEVACLPPRLDTVHEHYPFCVVWTSLPGLTWVVPNIGHIGICDSQGHIYDFQGDCTIVDDHMLFGNPTRYWDISKMFIPSFYSRPTTGDESKDEAHNEAVQREIEQYDQALFNVIQHFRRCERYNFFTNNCHAFVAACLNAQPLSTRREDTITVWFHMIVNGSYISPGRCLKTVLPFFIIVCIAALLVSILL